MKFWVFLGLLMSVSLGVDSAKSVNALLEKTQNFSKDKAKEHLASIPNPFSIDSAPNHSQPQNLHLQAILNKKVLINDEWLSLNDSVSGFKIIHIAPKNITLQKSSTNYTIKLNEPLP